MRRRWAKILFHSFFVTALGAGGTTCLALPQDAATSTSTTPAGEAPVALSNSYSREPAERRLDSSQDLTQYDDSFGLQLAKHFWSDQEAIWTIPARIRLADADWLMPLGVATGTLLATDTEFSKHLSDTASRLKYSNDFSNYGLGTMGGLAGGLYLWGEISRDDRKSETGVLAGEAAADSLAVVYALKYSFGRERPLQDEYRGNFRSGGDSFPSEHAAAAWSIASVVAHEYPSAFTQLMAYGMASAVSASRLTAKQHFPTDVLIGSAIGWASGQVVYRAHHDPELEGSTWGTFSESRDYLEAQRPRRSMGTPFVELDSWVYPAFDRLAGLGYLYGSTAGLRPWTRMQCALLAEEATEELQDNSKASASVSALVFRLRSEFSYEMGLLEGGRNMTASLESVYTRTVSISGPALTDGFHFGQTVSYDFGRPFERGTNGQVGGTFRAAAGPIAIYVRTEYQHAPQAPAFSDSVRSLIAFRDMLPEPSALPLEAINRPRLLDAYAAVNLGNWQMVVGKQSLSWGPGLGGSLLWSDNAEPVDMVRLVNSEPSRLPSLLKYLGPVTIDQFIGQLVGYRYTPHPQSIGFDGFRLATSLPEGFSDAPPTLLQRASLQRTAEGDLQLLWDRQESTHLMWELKLRLETVAHHPLGHISLLRRGFENPLLVDFNLLSREFRVALSSAMVRAANRNHSIVRSAMPQAVAPAVKVVSAASSD